jgi:hypothetical protein
MDPDLALGPGKDITCRIQWAETCARTKEVRVVTSSDGGEKRGLGCHGGMEGTLFWQGSFNAKASVGGGIGVSSSCVMDDERVKRRGTSTLVARQMAVQRGSRNKC